MRAGRPGPYNKSMQTAQLTNATSGRADPSWQPDIALNPRNAALTRALGQIEGRQGRILELGAGTARFLRSIRRRVPGLEGHACDMDPWGLRQATGFDPALAVLQADLTALPYRDGSFPTVVVFDVLEHLLQPERAVREAARVLEPGGLFHALVPCEGQPATLYWLMWKANIGADLKEKRVGHIQRFTHRSLTQLLETCGLRVTDVSYSMHWTGQIKDILMHAEEVPGFPHWASHNPLYRVVKAVLWAVSYVESAALARFRPSAVAVHVTAVKP